MGLVSYVQDIVEGFSSVWDAMVVGLQGYVDKPVTELYPDTKVRLPEHARMQLFMKFDDCIGCLQCATACPVDCIYIDTVKAPKAEGMPEQYLGKTSDGRDKRLYVTKFDIDMAKCCYCNLCTFPCPTGCLTMTPRFENSTFARNDLIYHFTKMTKDDVEKVNKAAEEEKKAAEAAKAAKAAAAPKPAAPVAGAVPAAPPKPPDPPKA